MHTFTYRCRIAVAALAALALLVVPMTRGGSYAGTDGAILAASGGKLYLAPLDGSTPSSSLHDGVDGSLSPDGSKLAYTTSTGQIGVYCIVGSCDATFATGTDPTWSPDGTTIAYVDTASQSLRTVAIASDGSAGTAQPVAPSESPVSGPTWSPDGTSLAFTATRGTSTEIWTVNVSTGVEKQLTSGPGDSHPAFSPGGTLVAFSSTVGGHTQISTVPSGGGTVTQLTNDTTSDTDPVWAPFADRIAFLQGGSLLRTIPLTGGSANEVTIGNMAWSAVSDWQTLVPSADPSTPPTISASSNYPYVGQTVSATPGSWTGAQTGFLYQFERCASDGTGCVAIGTASSSSSYTLASDDAGHTMRVLVTALDTAGASTPVQSSNATPVVAGPGPNSITLPAITQTKAPKVGDVLYATTGTWTGTSNTYAYRWAYCKTQTEDCVLDPAATSSFYLVPPVAYGQYIRIVIQATNSAGTREAESVAVGPVTAAAPAATSTPSISGIAETGATLIGLNGIWTGTSPITYASAWLRCHPACAPIPGATSTSYTVTKSDLGASIEYAVTATNVAGSVQSVSLPATPAPATTTSKPVAVGLPTITGTADVGSALAVAPGTWTGATPIAFRYAWKRCDATGASCRLIHGARRDQYIAVAADAGYTLRAVVTARNTVGVARATSVPTDTVAMVKRAVRGRRIIGTAHADYLPGGGGNDVIYGLGGNDTILGGAGDDRLYGGPGNDVIDGGPGSDHIYGGPGSDTIRAADGQRDWIDCGPGRDHAIVDRIDIVKNCESITYAD